MTNLVDTDIVCYCFGVTKGAIHRAIDTHNLSSTGDVMGITYAACNCGECINRVNAVTKDYLAQQERE